MNKIFIVEDDGVIASAIKKHLEQWGYSVKCAEDFCNVLSEFVAFDPQLVLMDISLPFYNGHHWCRMIRGVSKVPVVFLSSASDNMNIVMAMNMGGDDFIAKPFDLDVLTAKLQAMLRRSYDFAGSSQLIEHGGLILNISDGTASLSDGERIELSRNEYKILHILLENAGRIVERDMIMQKLWETDSYIDENTLSVNMTRLRKKLENAGLADYIHTRKGVGYIIE